jgi:hypothetical protein
LLADRVITKRELAGRKEVEIILKRMALIHLKVNSASALEIINRIWNLVAKSDIVRYPANKFLTGLQEIHF